MRNTSGIMEDNTPEDTMMDCGEDEKELDDLMELAANIANCSPSIKDAAERLLTLLGVDEENDDFSSEDEGVEVDLDDTDDDEDITKNSLLLQQLAVSLAQELKFSQRKPNTTRTIIQSDSTKNFPQNDIIQSDSTTIFSQNDIKSDSTTIFEKSIPKNQLQKDMQFMDISQDVNNDNKKYSDIYSRENNLTIKCLERNENENSNSSSCEFNKSFGKNFSQSSKREQLKKRCPYSRVKLTDGDFRRKEKLSNVESNLTSWNAGWNSCANETLRYLIVDEGLPPHHPTVVAMRNHLDLQREQAFLRSGSH
ncbi:uncharacterized protein LOC122511491 [Leptopilina heterotoma]|uniref:uncharacterized protein LOC122511491 n=1 Tax=Leptopilina heterotoma TaxID=63436 RepID=UPI001CA8AC79|nr:uncharacterized protein LOC122511491 [Leptopilina heterotoma]XP_043482695.1 uncharacterized protein LOC122511491 [Leptopilina heterotoma]XP_043482696.1 uncharacterized protein LOC122511491 [Leptopilina heterotoma]